MMQGENETPGHGIEIVHTGATADAMNQSRPTVALNLDTSTIDPNRTKTKKVIVLVALYFSLFPATLDATIVSTAIPTISNYFNTASGYAWIGSAYLLASAATSPLWGRFSDIWGRKPALLTALFIFFVTSIICAAAVDMAMLIAGRAVQGAAAGGIQILVGICIADLVSMRNRGFFTALIGVVWTTSNALGPLLGGVFSEKLSWRWCWWINLPITGAAFAAILLFLDLHNPRTSIKAGIAAVDWLGSVAIVGSAVMFLLGLDFGSATFPWDSPTVICLIVFGVAMIGIFVLSETKVARYPLIPPNLFRRIPNAATISMAFSHGFVHISGEFFLPLFFQSVFSASPVRSGILLIPLAVFQSVGTITSGIITSKTGHYIPQARLSMFLMTLCFGLFIMFNQSTPMAQIIGIEVLTGLCVGIGFSPPFTAIQAGSPQEDRAVALSTAGFSRTFGTAVSIVIGDVIFQARMKAKQPQLRSVLPPDVAPLFSSDTAAANVRYIETLSFHQRTVVRSAYSSSLSDMWILYSCMAFIGAISTLFMRHIKLERKHIETKTGIGQLLDHRKKQDATVEST